jgi:hypothetical protein
VIVVICRVLGPSERLNVDLPHALLLEGKVISCLQGKEEISTDRSVLGKHVTLCTSLFFPQCYKLFFGDDVFLVGKFFGPPFQPRSPLSLPALRCSLGGVVLGPCPERVQWLPGSRRSQKTVAVGSRAVWSWSWSVRVLLLSSASSCRRCCWSGSVGFRSAWLWSWSGRARELSIES